MLTPDVDESLKPGEAPDRYVRRLAQWKAHAVAARRPRAAVLAADTTVALESEIFGKPANRDEASAMLRRLSGHTHVVFTGIAITSPKGSHRRVVATKVRFRRLSRGIVDWYTGTGEPLDKAGAYAIQGAGAALVEWIHGSVSNVVGLPLVETMAVLVRAGAAVPWRVE